MLVTGPNGVGKTNLLEALHVGTQGFSPRTRADGRLVRLGEGEARVRLTGSESGSTFESEVALGRAGKDVRLNGAALPGADALRSRLLALAFTPDRLAIVKGGPLVRRAYFDRMLGRLFPARAALPGDYARALAQRNGALRRVRAGESSHAAVEPWTRQVAVLGSELDRRRGELVRALAPGFARSAEALGLANASLTYEERGLTVEELAARLVRDLERGTTGAGPHLADAAVAAGGRDLRAYGSQGEQRAAVLALALAEATLVAERRGEPPLLLLDDVLSELDETRRRALLAELPENGQSIVTATSRAALPVGTEPTLHVVVTPGDASAA